MGIQPFKKDKQDSQKKLVVRMYKEGNSFRQIAKVLKLSHETVRQLWLSTTIEDTA